MTYAEWVTKNPPPDLHDLVRRYGTYSAIPHNAWAQYDLEIARWQTAYQFRHYDEGRAE